MSHLLSAQPRRSLRIKKKNQTENELETANTKSIQKTKKKVSRKTELKQNPSTSPVRKLKSLSTKSEKLTSKTKISSKKGTNLAEETSVTNELRRKYIAGKKKSVPVTKTGSDYVFIETGYTDRAIKYFQQAGLSFVGVSKGTDNANIRIYPSLPKKKNEKIQSHVLDEIEDIQKNIVALVTNKYFLYRRGLDAKDMEKLHILMLLTKSNDGILMKGGLARAHGAKLNIFDRLDYYAGGDLTELSLKSLKGVELLELDYETESG